MKTTIHLTVRMALASAIIACCMPLVASAQKVVKYPQGKTTGTPSSLASTKHGADAESRDAINASPFTNVFSIFPFSDKITYEAYVEKYGKKPVASLPAKTPYGPEDDTAYTYTGFNQAAGLADDGTTQTGGMVNFNLKPFACDTVSSDAGLSPYSYICKGRMYCMLPIYDSSKDTYTGINRSVYDANTLQLLESRHFSSPKPGKDRMPYMSAYDDRRDVVWAISIGNNAPDGGEEAYYLNILDTATCSLQRVGYLGSWSSGRDKGNMCLKGFTANGGVLRVLNSDDVYYYCEIDPLTCSVKTIGSTKLPTEGRYGLQPMIYNTEQGNLLVNHYDFYNGTQYYEMQTFVPWGSEEDTCKVTLIENAPTGFTWMYRRPETLISYYNYHLAPMTHLEVASNDDGTKATIKFTVPDTDADGNKIEIPSWSSDKVRVYLYVDNNYTTSSDMPSTIKLGSEVECTIDITPGMHIVAVQLYPMYNELEGNITSKVITGGYDAPANVGNPSFTAEGTQAVITWTAPTAGRYEDFGSTFDATDLTYKVVRNMDGKVIADGIKETTATDDALPQEIQSQSYTIYAISHNLSSTGISTPSQTVGEYIALPYTNSFSSQTDFEGFTVINADDNGTMRTWYWNSWSKTVTSGWGSADDWMISPKLKLEGGKLYSFSFKLNGVGQLFATIGSDNTAEAQTITLDEYTKAEESVKECFFRPDADGIYYFAFHNYNSSDEECWTIDDLAIKQVAVETAPDKVEAVNVIPDEKGALGATVSIKLPTNDINGNTIDKLTKWVIEDENGNLLAENGNATPGAETSVHVDAAKGFNTWRISAFNDNGQGWPYITSAFIGPDKPQSPKNVVAQWGEEENIVKLSWTASEEGENGGYVDPATLNYSIYKYDDGGSYLFVKLGECGNDTEIDVQIMDAIVSKQDQYVFGITASNDEGESDYTKRGIVLGKAYNMPFDEPVNAQGLTHSPWLLVPGINNQSWTVDGGFYNDKVQPYDNDGAQFVFLNNSDADASGAIATPIIDFTQAEQPMLKVWIHHSDNIPAEASVDVVASTDGNTTSMVEVSPAQRINGNGGWTQHVFDLSSLCGKKAQVALRAFVPDPSVRVFADNWSISEAAGNDLAASLSVPYMPVVGDETIVTVTVANMGKQTADDYSVLFNVNNEVIDAADAEVPLMAGQSAEYQFKLSFTAAQKDVVYSAELVYDDDNADNNKTAEVEVNARQLDLPAPANLAATDNALSWDAPEVMDGRAVTLDFESVPSFLTDNIDGWHTVDVDKNLTCTFIQYYDNYWPYAGKPLAWMTWSAREAGCPTANGWQPMEGEKCLIHWGNYGADAEGRPSTDADDDWLISPEIKGGTTFSFSTLANDLTNLLEIRTSSASDTIEDFTQLVTSVDYTTTGTWKNVEVTLPADAKYVAIRCIKDGFGTLIDNINYTLAGSPVLQQYNVYNGSEVITSVFTNAAQASGNGQYAVSAVYNLGESALSNEVTITTGIADLTMNNVKVAGHNHQIVVTGAEGMNVQVYNVAGGQMAAGKASASTSFRAPAGVYIVTVNGKPYKVTVK